MRPCNIFSQIFLKLYYHFSSNFKSFFKFQKHFFEIFSKKFSEFLQHFFLVFLKFSYKYYLKIFLKFLREVWNFHKTFNQMFSKFPQNFSIFSLKYLRYFFFKVCLQFFWNFFETTVQELSQKYCTVCMTVKIWVEIRFCWPVVYSLNCYKVNNGNVSLIFHNVRVVQNKAENFSAHVTESEQPTYIKVETLCGNAVPIIHTLLKEVCGNITLDRSTVRW